MMQSPLFQMVGSGLLFLNFNVKGFFMTDIQLDTRVRMCRFLPKALETALASYRRMSRKAEHDYTDYKKQQDACKVALGHVQLLLKLGGEVVGALPDDTPEDEHKVMMDLIKHAQVEIDGS